MSGRTPEQEKREAQQKIQIALHVQQYATMTRDAARQMDPLVADAFQPGVERAETTFDNVIRQYATDYLGMVSKGPVPA